MRLKQRIKLQQSTPTQDSHGQLVESWTTYRNCFANVRDGRGDEVTRGDGQDFVADAIVTIRYPREGRFPAAADRVLFVEGISTTRTLNIVDVRRTDEQRRWVELTVKEQP